MLAKLAIESKHVRPANSIRFFNVIMLTRRLTAVALSMRRHGTARPLFLQVVGQYFADMALFLNANSRGIAFGGSLTPCCGVRGKKHPLTSPESPIFECRLTSLMYCSPRASLVPRSHNSASRASWAGCMYNTKIHMLLSVPASSITT